MANAKVEVYTRSYCGYCMRAKLLLDEKDVDYTEISIDGDPDMRQVMIERIEGSSNTVPQIFINGKSVGGCMELFALERSGELDELLAESE